ncbi:Basic leucine zipper [Cordyceps fumosorosea ARSEF 2679]|uniref:Basic leucine zipper n=1 Tax=Cordyceps fumosorosea (strain ARSEF 2679) TaxID=1081104 RepID=A0A168EE87_CORFA|nr:Basic leucine zipper [Cordyceps fumosorosea ARSEF 2679]OAA73710.1 Basic leucine zipper [Cordyceps fumosorosea ARSEF 2679]
MSILEFMGPGYTPAGMDPTEFFVNGDEPYVLASDYTILPQPTPQHLVVPPLPGTIEGAAAELLSLSPGTTVLPESLPSSGAPATTTTVYKQHGSPSSTGSSSASRKRGRLPSPPVAAEDLDEEEEEEAVIKRRRNTMAARKYRQKRLDRISDLERSLGDMTDQRDELKLRLARKEAEVDALREMLSRK